MGAGPRDVRAVREADLPQAREVLHAALRADPVSRWIFPEEEHCEAHHPLLFGAFLENAFRHGTAEMTPDGLAVALWFEVVDGEQPGADELGALMERVDPGNPRVLAIGETTEAVHPHASHAYLQAIAVRPERQSEGIGGALLRRALDRYDAAGLPAYLEASNEGSRALYERYGFALRGEPLRLPDGGPLMWPMWREPKAG